MKILLLIVYYVGFMIAGDLSDYLIGLIVEREFGSQVSPIFAYVGRLGPCSWEANFVPGAGVLQPDVKFNQRAIRLEPSAPATTLGLEVPPTLLARADEVIE